MADSNLAAVRAALEQRFRDGVVARQPNRSTVTLNLFPKMPGKGKNIAFDITVGTAIGRYYDDGEDVSTFNDDTELPTTLDWAEVGDAMAVTGRAEDTSAANSNELGRLYLKKLKDCRDRVAAKANLELIIGDGTTAPQKFLGLLGAGGPLDSTGTYGTVPRATYPQFAGNRLANGAVPRPVTHALIAEALRAVYDRTGEVCDCMVTTTALWDKIALLVEDQNRYVKQATIGGRKFTADAGYEIVMYRGIPILKEKDMVTQTLVGLSMNHVGMEILPVAAATADRGDVIAKLPIAGTPEEQGMSPQEVAARAGISSIPLLACLYKLARTGRKSKFQLVFTAQVWCDRPASCFILEDLDES